MHARLTPVPVRLPPHGVLVWESRHDVGFRMASERHPFLEIFYVIAGSGWFVLDDARHPCRAGEMVVVPPKTTHYIEDAPKDPFALYGICLAPHLLDTDPAVLIRLPCGPLAVGPVLSSRVRTELRRLLFEQTVGCPGSRTLVLGLALQLVATLAQGREVFEEDAPNDDSGSIATRQQRAVERYLTELPYRFYEPMTIDQVAAELGMSRRCFTRLFRAAAGTSWSRWIEAARVEYACRLLRETGRSVATIAFECGYEELSSFYRAFKRRTGSPPRRWRDTAPEKMKDR